MARIARSVGEAKDAAVDRIVAGAVSAVVVLIPPWTVLLLSAAAAALFHALWGRAPAVAWAAAGMTLATVALAVVTWAVSHQRGGIGRAHSTGTTLLAGLWVTVATITGVSQQVTLYMVIIGGGTLALSWNIRTVIRNVSGGQGGTDPLAELFASKKESFGLGGARLRTLRAGEHKIEARMDLPAGQLVVADVQKKVAHVESGMGLPPGAVLVHQDEDRADRAQFTLTDPRVMKNDLIWPGPSMPAGGSIADAMRLGLYQDMDEVLYTALDHHLQIMGMSGSGKSFGGTWNLAAEMITRADVAIWGIDITKGDQTLGALEESLDWVAYDPVTAVKLLAAIEQVIKPRTAHLSSRHLSKWEKGCGLTYLVVVLEEAPDIFGALGSKALERFLSTLKAARSAGIFIVISLQRADWTQIETVARAQMAGKWCFGVESPGDAKFGLPDHVRDAGASPQRWGASRPGMSYLAAPRIPDPKLATANRTYLIDATAMRTHAAAYPATARPLDVLTTAAAGPAYAERIITGPGVSVWAESTRLGLVTGTPQQTPATHPNPLPAGETPHGAVRPPPIDPVCWSRPPSSSSPPSTRRRRCSAAS